ncbi:hypothetical protein [Arundinibacter roseus]|uniref:Uncharacterized protein n=1 Tax=Arundinibacter roseus TaxID=2070510 RepID=A0A4R4KDF8_9BACT|nr:hypothetical protein [Arundinibacter roseus]TDB64379.1 hypothetical protein EZE20_11895 [Arundinibacter roseus]
MSRIAQRQKSLSENIERFRTSGGNETAERASLSSILRDMHFLAIPPSSLITVQDRKANLLNLLDDAGSGRTVESIESDRKVSYPCASCGKPHPTPQARAAHGRFCKKGGRDGQ